MVFLWREGGRFSLLLKVRPKKIFRIKKDQKNRSKQVDTCPKQDRAQAKNLEIKTDRNPPITNYKPWPFELFEMNVYRLRGPLSWGHKSGRHLKNHSSLAGGISISRGFAAKTHSTATQYCQLRRLETTGHPDLKYNEKWVFRCSFSISTYPRKKRKAIIDLIWFYFSGAFCIIVSVGLLYRKCDVWATLVWKKNI